MKFRITVFAILMSIILMILTFNNDALAANLSDGLVGYWPLDNSGADHSGYGNNATIKGGAKWVKNGWIGGALEVDGISGHAVVDRNFTLMTDKITVIARIKGWKTVDWAGVVIGRNDPSTFGLGFNDQDTAMYIWNNNSINTWFWHGAPHIPKDEWVLMAIVIQPEKATSYIYHKKNGKFEFADNKRQHIQQTVLNLNFGWDECCGGNRYFRGLIDEVMIFERALSMGEIKKLSDTALTVASKGKMALRWSLLKSSSIR